MGQREKNGGGGCCCGPVARPARGPEDAASSTIRPASGAISWADRWDHFLARWGYRRTEHKV